MPTYISLVQFTDKGIQAAKETTQRVADWATRVQSMGVRVKEMYWTLGEYDQVCVFDAVAFPPLDNRPDTNRSSGPLGTVSGQRASVRVQSHDGSLFHTSSVASVASGGGPNQSSARHRRTFRGVLRNPKVNAHYQRK